MIKVMSLMRRAEGMPKAEYVTWARDEHPAFARELPGLRRYLVSTTAADADTPYDSVSEMYFDDEDARAAAFASEAGKAAAADAGAHTSERVHLITTEYQPF
jgi:uncharacterized protein (TIGR02118 family)